MIYACLITHTEKSPSPTCSAVHICRSYLRPLSEAAETLRGVIMFLRTLRQSELLAVLALECKSR